MAKIHIVSITSAITDDSLEETLHIFLNEDNAKAYLKKENDRILKRITKKDGTIGDEWYCESDEHGYYYTTPNGYWLEGKLITKDSEG